MPEYVIDCGNSSVGPIGFTARVTAGSPEQALEMLKDELPDFSQVLPWGDDSEVHLNVYFNADAITLADVDVEEEEEEEKE